MFENAVDVDALPRRRTVVGEGVDAVDQLADAVGLLADHLRQFAFGAADRAFDQLRGAADAGKRVLYLVRQHRSHAGHRTRRGTVVEMPVDDARHRTFDQADEEPAIAVAERGDVRVHQALAQPRARQRDAVFAHAGARARRQLHQRDEWAVGRQQFRDPVAGEIGAAPAEQLLGRRVRELDAPRTAQRKDGDRHGAEKRRRGRGFGSPGRSRRIHRRRRGSRSVARRRRPLIGQHSGTGPRKQSRRTRNSNSHYGDGRAFPGAPASRRHLRCCALRAHAGETPALPGAAATGPPHRSRPK